MSRSWSIRRREEFAGLIEQDLTQRALQRLLAATAREWNLPYASFAMPAARSGARAGDARPHAGGSGGGSRQGGGLRRGH
jgi:hypothetical protein